MPSSKSAILAAGALLWRPDALDGSPHVAVIHRPRYDDWSLPKGKVDPGESEPVTAVREILEETGFASVLGRRLPAATYSTDAGEKKVHFWAARVTDGSFTPNDEVDELVWLPPAQAIKRLEYPHDRKVVRKFAKQPADTSTVLVVRHATAGSRSRFKGDDTQRPLDKNGRAQAEALVGVLLAFGATSVYSADRVRCRQTVEPLAQELGVEIQNEKRLSEEAYAESAKHARARLLELAGSGGTPVICSQGKVIPHLVQWWCERDGVKPDKSRNRKGSVWVLSLANGKLSAADHIGSPLPVR